MCGTVPLWAVIIRRTTCSYLIFQKRYTAFVRTIETSARILQHPRRSYDGKGFFPRSIETPSTSTRIGRCHPYSAPWMLRFLPSPLNVFIGFRRKNVHALGQWRRCASICTRKAAFLVRGPGIVLRRRSENPARFLHCRRHVSVYDTILIEINMYIKRKRIIDCG